MQVPGTAEDVLNGAVVAAQTLWAEAAGGGHGPLGECGFADPRCIGADLAQGGVCLREALQRECVCLFHTHVGAMGELLGQRGGEGAQVRVRDVVVALPQAEKLGDASGGALQSLREAQEEAG